MIGNLANDMMRLCGEIATLQDSRAVLRSNLAQDRNDRKDTVSQMQADFRHAQAEMAAKTKSELNDFVANVKDAVAGLKERVATLREEFMEDIAGARRAWHGHTSGHAPARMAAEDQPKEFAPKGKKKKR